MLRPRAIIVVGAVLASLFLIGATFLLVTFRDAHSLGGLDRAAIVLLAVVVVVVAAVLGRPRVVADDVGLLVQNPIRRRRLVWEQVLAVRFGRDDSWLRLELSDGTTLPVLAVQSADGARARADADWLRARVTEHEAPGG